MGTPSDLDLGDNLLNGNIPSGLWALTNLRGLYLDRNNLVGQVEVGLSSLQQLRVLWVFGNSLSGTLPGAALGRLSLLQFLDVSANGFGGSFPTALMSLTALQEIDISSNSITGSLPPAISSLQGLRSLQVSANDLQGTLPDTLSALGQLSALGVSDNALRGTLPLGLTRLGLSALFVDNNYLEGVVPSTLLAVPDTNFNANCFTSCAFSRQVVGCFASTPPCTPLAPRHSRGLSLVQGMLLGGGVLLGLALALVLLGLMHNRGPCKRPARPGVPGPGYTLTGSQHSVGGPPEGPPASDDPPDVACVTEADSALDGDLGQRLLA